MKKLRLLITTKCHKNCDGCCNKDWDLSGLPVCNDYSQYGVIMFTGGEPMLNIARTLKIALEIKEANPTAYLYVYTALMYPDWGLMSLLLRVIDGITLTIHDQRDANGFVFYHNKIYQETRLVSKVYSLRLNVFKDCNLFPIEMPVKETEVYDTWDVRDNIEWIKDCPLPDGEIFMRYEKTPL